MSAGTTYLPSSKPLVLGVEECKQSCQIVDGCQSITYFRNSEWCSHFGNPCTDTKKSKNTVSYRLSKTSDLLMGERPPAPIGQFDSLILLLENSSTNAEAVIFFLCGFDHYFYSSFRQARHAYGSRSVSMSHATVLVRNTYQARGHPC